ncbi:hypothetical protein NWU98_001142 [Vibrio vulnificus]|nr:hypothetical protein [Vibrio vulnificus]HDY7869181.1 hypothetical protein [Vibrio vulnificus]
MERSRSRSARHEAEEKWSKYDLFKDKDGNIFVKPKKGNGPGEFTGFNIYNL